MCLAHTYSTQAATDKQITLATIALRFQCKREFYIRTDFCSKNQLHSFFRVWMSAAAAAADI